MQFGEVQRVLDELESKEIRYWVAGGWGVAALSGEQTREHRDLDLAINSVDLVACVQCLASLGYTRETDWFPVRVEFICPGRGWIDMHPVVFDHSGHGRQQDLDGGHFEYPAASFTVGRVRARDIPCLSLTQQRAFHSGYIPREQDLHDLKKMDALDGAACPEEGPASRR